MSADGKKHSRRMHSLRDEVLRESWQWKGRYADGDDLGLYLWVVSMTPFGTSMPCQVTSAFTQTRRAQLRPGGSGGAPHLAAELFKSMAHIDIVRVAYKGGGQALNAVMAGELHLMFPVAASAMPHVRTGRIRVLGITSAKSSPLLPDVPTIAAAVPGYEAVASSALFAPLKTPPAIVQRLQSDTATVLRRADVRERFLHAGSEPIGSSTAELVSMIQSEVTRMTKVIRESGIRSAD